MISSIHLYLQPCCGSCTIRQPGEIAWFRPQLHQMVYLAHFELGDILLGDRICDVGTVETGGLYIFMCIIPACIIFEFSGDPPCYRIFGLPLLELRSKMLRMLASGWPMWSSQPGQKKTASRDLARTFSRYYLPGLVHVHVLGSRVCLCKALAAGVLC